MRKVDLGAVLESGTSYYYVGRIQITRTCRLSLLDFCSERKVSPNIARCGRNLYRAPVTTP